MKNSIKSIRKERGQAIITVMIVVVVAVVLIAAVAYVSSARALVAKRLADKIKATAIAEAGVAAAYSVLTTNWVARYDVNAFPAVSYGGGRYDVTVRPVGSNMALVISTGFYSTVSASVMADLKNYGGTTNGGGGIGGGADAFDYAMVSGGNIMFVGNMDMDISNGWFHANGSLSGNGNQTIHGNVSSSTSIDFPNITGTADAPTVSGTVGTRIEGVVAPVIIPNIDLTPYYNEALANGQVFTGPVNLSGPVTPTGGIMWVNGDISFSGGTFTGCFIATGNINTGTGNSDYVFRKVNQYPTLVCRDGSMNWQGGNGSLVDFQGLIYLKTGSFNKQGNGDVLGHGSIIAAGGISKNGGWSGMFYSDSTPVPPGGGDDGLVYPVDQIGISAWQK